MTFPAPASGSALTQMDCSTCGRAIGGALEHTPEAAKGITHLGQQGLSLTLKETQTSHASLKNTLRSLSHESVVGNRSSRGLFS